MTPAAKYHDLADRAQEMHAAALARHYGVTDSTMWKALKCRGIKAIPAPKAIQVHNAEIGRRARAIKFRNQHKAVALTDHRAKTQADLAADHLRRLSSVWRCNENGSPNPKGKFWRRGWAILTDAELIARAVAKGFDPSAWMRVAA